MLMAKVMLLGDMGVGKTSILYRLVHNRFDGQYKTTLGVEMLSYEVPEEHADEAMRLVLWDTDGDFGTRIFETVYVAGSSAAIIVADVTRPQTIARAAELARVFEERFPGRPWRLLLNKIDLVDQARGFDGTEGLPPAGILQVSAKTGNGVPEAFAGLAGTIRRRQD